LASPARPHSSDGERRACPRDVPGPPSTPNRCREGQRKKMKLARGLEPRPTHGNRQSGGHGSRGRGGGIRGRPHGRPDRPRLEAYAGGGPLRPRAVYTGPPAIDP
jgi:hypothetical protein